MTGPWPSMKRLVACTFTINTHERFVLPPEDSRPFHNSSTSQHSIILQTAIRLHPHLLSILSHVDDAYLCIHWFVYCCPLPRVNGCFPIACLPRLAVPGQILVSYSRPYPLTCSTTFSATCSPTASPICVCQGQESLSSSLDDGDVMQRAEVRFLSP
jgi:hypothetical protein